MRDFQYYVLGMSLEKLHDAMKEPRWKFRTKETLEMRKFLCSEDSLSMIRVPESIPFQEKETPKSFLKLLEVRGTSIGHQTELDVKAKRFTSNIAIAFHGLLKSYFTQIQVELENLRQKKSKTEYDQHLPELYRGLCGLKICTEQLEEMLDLYLKSLKIVETPSTPGSCDDNAAEDPEEEIEDEAWVDAFKTWIAGLVRQIRATSLLTSLHPSRKTQILKIDFTLIEQATPDTSMEWWRTTIKGIYGEEKARSDKVCKALSTIASGNAPDDKTYQQLKREDWTQSFQGAVHCEAMLAVTQCNSKKMVSAPRIMQIYVLILSSINSTSAFPTAVASRVLLYSRKRLAFATAWFHLDLFILGLLTRSGVSHYHLIVRSSWQKRSVADLTWN